MDPHSHQQFLPEHQTPSFLTPEKLPSPSSNDLSSKKRASVLNTHSEFRPSKLFIDSPANTQSLTSKTAAHIQATSRKFLDEISEIDHTIYKAKLPFLKYYDPITEKIKSREEITQVIEKSYDFFQADASLFQGSEYKPKDYYFCTPKKKSNRTLSSKYNTISRINNTLTTINNSAMNSTGNRKTSINFERYESLKRFQPEIERELKLTEEILFGDGMEKVKGGNDTSSIGVSIETAPSSKQLQSQSQSRESTLPNTAKNTDKKFILVESDNGLMTEDLYKGMTKRRALLAEMKKGGFNKPGAAQIDEVIKRSETQYGVEGIQKINNRVIVKSGSTRALNKLTLNLSKSQKELVKPTPPLSVKADSTNKWKISVPRQRVTIKF